MNYDLTIFLLNPDLRMIIAIYEPEKDGSGHGTPVKKAPFKTFNTDIKVDDIVVVPSSTRHGFTTCKVVEVDADVDFDSRDPCPWIVAHVDVKEYERFKDMEKEALSAVKSAEREKKRKELSEAMFANEKDKLKDLSIVTITHKKEE